jgi:hypothetical protein
VRGCAEAVPAVTQPAVVSHTAFDGTKVPPRGKSGAPRASGRISGTPGCPWTVLIKSNIAYWVTPAAPWGIHLIGYALPPEGQDTRNGCSDEDG